MEKGKRVAFPWKENNWQSGTQQMKSTGAITDFSGKGIVIEVEFLLFALALWVLLFTELRHFFSSV